MVRSSYPPRASKVIVHEPPVRTQPSVDPEVVTAAEIQEDSFVYVHCNYNNPGKNTLIRVWKTTFLTDMQSNARSSLVHAENISMAPEWTLIPDERPYSFLLIFSALPKSCRQFDLREEISQPGGFHVRHIMRNETDVYHITLE
jgi:hypothetical protein